MYTILTIKNRFYNKNRTSYIDDYNSYVTENPKEIIREFKSENVPFEVTLNMKLKISGKTYSERKNSLRELAVEFSHLFSGEIADLSWGEESVLQDFFERNGKRYGLLEEFRENAIC